MSNFADRRGAIARAAHRTGRYLIGAALVCGGIASGSAGAGAETYQSLRLGGALEGLVLAADPRLTFGSEGTLEFWIAADADSADNQCVIAHGGGEDSGFAVLMHNQRQAIYLQTPAGTYTVSFDFSDGAFHHVAFQTAGGQTSAVIDGATPTQPGDGDERIEQMPAWFSFGEVPSPGLALDIGCTGPAPFDGWLASLRFWDKALEPDELRWASNSYGYPKVEFDQRRQALLDQHLIAYATFTDERQSFYYTEPALEVLTDGTPGGPGTAAVLSRRLPEGVGRDGLAAIYAKVTQRAVEQLRFEYPGWGDIPMILPRAPGWTGADQVRLEELRGQVLAAGDNERRRQELITEGRRLQIGFNRLTETGRTAAGRTQWEIMEMEPGEVITRVAAIYAPGSITRLSLRTDRRTLPILNSGRLSGDVFSLSLPAYARYEGVEIGRDADGRLQSIGLVFSREPVPAADRPLLALTQGLWIPEDSCPPRLADEKAHEAGHARPLTGIARLHGLYTTPTVGRFFFDPDRQRVDLYLDHVRFNLPFDDQGSCGEPQPGNRFVDGMGFARQTHAGANPNQLIDTAVPARVGLAIKDEGTVIAPFGPLPLATGPLVRAPRPPATDTDKIAWGGTFALPHRPANVRSNFVGYDITQLDPHNFLRSHGLKQLVFDYPADDSTDYQTTDNSLIVPRGVHFKSDVSAVEDAHTVMVAGAFEYKYAWSMSIGLNLGFGLDGISAAFSANASYGKRSQTRQQRQVITSITRTAEVRYALIADRTRIELSPAFRDRVLALRDDYLVDQISDASVITLIKRFGTHYPYAVTYGGMAFLETDYSEQLVGHMTGTSRSFEEQSSVSFANESKSNGCGCAGGGSPGSASFGVDTSVEDDRELSTEVQNAVDSHIFGTYGGSATRGEGWSLSPGQEVPLFFDLRPLHELLSPIFFDDPIVWDVLAPALERETRAHLRRAIDADRDAKPGWYDTNRENELRRHEPRVFDHAYKAAR